MQNHNKIFDEILKEEERAKENSKNALAHVNELLAKSDNKELNALCRSIISQAQKGQKPNIEDFINKAKEHAS